MTSCKLGLAVDDVVLQGDLVLPESTMGLVLFAHGSGSSRHSPRNRFVAEALRDSGISTLLFDLLTPDEEERDRFTRELRFDVGLLSRRLLGVVARLRELGITRGLKLGYFGASTGAAAALMAAAERPDWVRAVVARGGRPDLAGEALEAVRAPTLFIVGGADGSVLQLNEFALDHVGAWEKRLEVIEGATHLFEEAGALERVASLARGWFHHHLLVEDEWRGANATGS